MPLPYPEVVVYVGDSGAAYVGDTGVVYVGDTGAELVGESPQEAIRHYRPDAVFFRPPPRCVDSNGTVGETVSSFEVSSLDGKLVDAIKVLTDALETVPADYRDRACLDVNYEEYGATLSVTYRRPATGEERRAHDEYWTRRHEIEAERERRLLAELKAKYET